MTNLSSVKKVLERGDTNRRTASTGWNEGSGRSHSAFRIVIESRERGSGSLSRRDEEGSASGRMTPTGRMTPGLRPQEERSRRVGMGGVFRHLLWYEQCVLVMLPADTCINRR